MKFRLRKAEIMKSFVWLVILTVGIILYYWKLYGQICVGDGMFLAGLLFFCVGLFRVVRWLGFFDSTIYGFNKIFGRTDQDQIAFLNEHPYTQSFGELLILSLGFMGISLIL